MKQAVAAMRQAVNQAKAKALPLMMQMKQRTLGFLAERTPATEGPQPPLQFGTRAAVILLAVAAGAAGVGYAAYTWRHEARAGLSAARKAAPEKRKVDRIALAESDEALETAADDSRDGPPSTVQGEPGPRTAKEPAGNKGTTGAPDIKKKPAASVPDSRPPAPKPQPPARKPAEPAIRTEMALVRDLSTRVHAAGLVKADERRLYAVAPRFDGWVERMHAGATGQTVQRGQALFDAYSPELNAVQKEYHLARSRAAKEGGDGLAPLAKVSMNKLENLGVGGKDLKRLREGGKPARTIALRAPVTGVILEKKAERGMRFASGDILYRIADLSSVWVVAEVPESQVAAVRNGQPATLVFDAYPGRTFNATLAHVYPTANPRTRSVQVRIQLDNRHGLFKPGMRAGVNILTGDHADELVIPASAVIAHGGRRAVLVKTDGGRFAPREVWLGVRRQHQVAVVRGLGEGERVAVGAESVLAGNRGLHAALHSMLDGTGREAANATGTTYRAEGTIEDIDRHAGTLLISHGPVPRLKWRANALDFTASSDALLRSVSTGQKIRFEFIAPRQGEYVVTRLLGPPQRRSADRAKRNAPAQRIPG